MVKQNPKSVSDVVQVVENAELTGFPAWSDLDILSTNTTIDGIEVDPSGVTIAGDRFSGVANIYVVLEYGGGEPNGFTTSDSFLGKFEGHFEDKKPVLDEFTVDTSSFYEGEQPEG